MLKAYKILILFLWKKKWTNSRNQPSFTKLSVTPEVHFWSLQFSWSKWRCHGTDFVNRRTHKVKDSFFLLQLSKITISLIEKHFRMRKNEEFCIMLNRALSLFQQVYELCPGVPSQECFETYTILKECFET